MSRIFLTTVEARENFAELIDRAATSGERIVITRHGEPMAALVSLDDLELIEELERRLEQKARRQRAAAPHRRHDARPPAAEQMRIWSGEE
ncbi:MAG TPA: type II toxin-antitoxin system Phd/YefM family antitoxin [Longimicrobiales bacterium]|nr:type II toxin-antitoxin system Phd/YefM family antitoxin [Longimicrobiales bacterium]